VGEVFGQFRNDVEQFVQFLRVAASQVVRRQEIERRDAYPHVVAPLEELPVLGGTGAVTVRSGFELTKTCPATVAVNDHRDVPRQRLAGERPFQPVLVQAIQKATTEGNLPLLHSATLVHRPLGAGRKHLT
jgi:hypothetical protein